MSTTLFEIAVIGGGIAGVSAAAHLADTHSVVLLEQEGELATAGTSKQRMVKCEQRRSSMQLEHGETLLHGPAG